MDLKKFDIYVSVYVDDKNSFKSNQTVSGDTNPELMKQMFQAAFDKVMAQLEEKYPYKVTKTLSKLGLNDDNSR